MEARIRKGKQDEHEQQRRKQEEEVEVPTESSPYVQHKDVEDYKMRGYGVQGHLPVSDVPHGGTGTDAPTMPGTAVPPPRRHSQLLQGDDDGAAEAATDTINRYGVP